MTYLAYAGIGSRSSSQDILDQMTRIARFLAVKSYTLRSGGADGADTAFMHGVNTASLEGYPKLMEIYTPWHNFNNLSGNYILEGASEEAEEIASRYHPAWHKCSSGAKKLHARNTHQILGTDCKSPVRFVLYWCPKGPDGRPQGGTAQALRIAESYEIPMYMIGTPECNAFIGTL